MPSTAASHMIFFIAAIVVSVSIAGALISTTNNFADDIRSKGNDMGDNIRTDIKIVNDEVAMPYNASNNTLTLYVMNTGSISIGTSNSTIIVMVNGTYFENLTFVIPGGGSVWKPKTLLIIVVGDITLPADDYRLKVIAQLKEDEMNFRIS